MLRVRRSGRVVCGEVDRQRSWTGWPSGRTCPGTPAPPMCLDASRPRRDDSLLAVSAPAVLGRPRREARSRAIRGLMVTWRSFGIGASPSRLEPGGNLGCPGLRCRTCRFGGGSRLPSTELWDPSRRALLLLRIRSYIPRDCGEPPCGCPPRRVAARAGTDHDLRVGRANPGSGCRSGHQGVAPYAEPTADQRFFGSNGEQWVRWERSRPRSTTGRPSL